MTEDDQAFQERIRGLARSMQYPETPDIAGRATVPARKRARWGAARRPLLWAASAALLLVVVLILTVPAARAAVGQVIRLGVVRILLGAEAPTNTPELGLIVPTARSAETWGPGGAIDIAGETSLEDATTTLPFPLRLPTHPPGLGRPDRVFLQGQPAAGVVLVWTDSTGQPELALFELTEGVAVSKLDPTAVATATVDGAQALWTTGPYLVEIEGGRLEARRLIDGHVLIWTEGALTYRLEGDLPLAEAIRIAKSLE